MAIAFVIGSYDGFFGPGTGTFLIFAFVWFFEARPGASPAPGPPPPTGAYSH